MFITHDRDRTEIIQRLPYGNPRWKRNPKSIEKENVPKFKITDFFRFERSKKFVKQENWSACDMSVLESSVSENQTLRSISSLAASTRTCIGFSFSSISGEGKLIFGIEGTSRNLFVEDYPIYFDKKILEHFKIEDANGRAVSMLFNKDRDFDEDGMEVKLSNLWGKRYLMGLKIE